MVLVSIWRVKTTTKLAWNISSTWHLLAAMFYFMLWPGDVFIYDGLWIFFRAFNSGRMQGGEINNKGTLCVSSLVFCLIFVRVKKGIIWLTMVGDKRKVKRPIAELDLHELNSHAQRKALWESCMFELELPQDN